VKAFLLATVILLGGCSTDDKGLLHGEYLMVRDCQDGIDHEFKRPEGYSMTGRFFAVDHLNDVAFIRMQPGGKHLDRTDALLIQLNDIDFVRRRLGKPLHFDSPHVRSALHLMGSCPDSSQALVAISGSITFTEFGTNKDDVVQAEFNMDFVDERYEEVVGLNFKGEFEFTVKVGPPYQPFVPE